MVEPGLRDVELAHVADFEAPERLAQVFGVLHFVRLRHGDHRLRAEPVEIARTHVERGGEFRIGAVLRGGEPVFDGGALLRGMDAGLLGIQILPHRLVDQIAPV